MVPKRQLIRFSDLSLKRTRTFSSSEVLPALPQCDFTPTSYTGPSLEAISKVRRERMHADSCSSYSKPIIFHQGHMQWLFDSDGKRYLDLFGGICTVSVGHCHPKVTEAVNEQMKSLGHISSLYYHTKIHKYAERLTDLFPDDLKVVYFVNSGSEATELALILAKSYTKRPTVLSLTNSYHGSTLQAMTASGNTFFKYPFAPAVGTIHVMNPDVYRGVWGGKYCRDSTVQARRSCSCTVDGECEAKQKYLQQLSSVFKYSSPKEHVAAFLVESIQGIGGIVQYPKGYIKGAYDLVKDSGGLFISDEVQTGFGRTGDKFWGFEDHGIKPDIVTMAKGIGNGFPLAAVVTTAKIAAGLRPNLYFNTYGGNPIACAAGIAVLDVIKQDKLQLNCRIVGTYLLNELERLSKDFPVIGDVRGKGLMIGVELVGEDGTAPLAPELVREINDKCRELGLIVGKGGVDGNILRIQPPMCITKEDADFGVAVLKHALKTVCQK